MGVTGANSEITTDISAMIELVKKVQDIPCAVSFNISTPQQVKQMADKSDGIIVDSQIVEICEKYGKDCITYIEDYVKKIKQAIVS